MSSNTNELFGIIPVNKPSGWTSFDVVAKMRGILKIRRIGHSGTLDPMATGVLPVFLGKATKACDMIEADGKAYVAGFRLGVTTDTQDISGEILKTSDRAVTLSQLEEAAKQFVGEIMQVPPMYSAVKVGGKKLYELAREGKTVEREAKKRFVDFIKIEEYDEEAREGKMSFSVSKGTYIRTLINDIGDRLSCGGTMTSLVRTQAGGFDLSQCKTIEEIASLAESGEIANAIKPLSEMFSSLEKVTLGRRETTLYKNGVKLRPEQAGIKAVQDNKSYAVFGFDGDFLGIAQADTQKNELKSVKNFY